MHCRRMYLTIYCLVGGAVATSLGYASAAFVTGRAHGSVWLVVTVAATIAMAMPAKPVLGFIERQRLRRL